jgi:hypothetical protein
VTAQQAATRWQSRQARLLKATYLKGWQAGVRNFRSQQPASTRQRGATPAAPALATPPTATMSQALSPALTSLARMGAQLAVIVPTAAQLAVAGTVAAATLLAVKEFLKTSGWLLAAGVSVAWAGEQAGYAHAADANGFLLRWQLDPRAEHCDDCPLLAMLPPLPLAMWPTFPGDGATECNVGCKCSLQAVTAEIPVLTAEQQELLSRIGNRQPVLIAA